LNREFKVGDRVLFFQTDINDQKIFLNKIYTIVDVSAAYYTIITEECGKVELFKNKFRKLTPLEEAML
jgi:predicted methyltransferase